jgi:hypothetical protein
MWAISSFKFGSRQQAVAAVVAVATGNGSKHPGKMSKGWPFSACAGGFFFADPNRNLWDKMLEIAYPASCPCQN